ncbi:aldo/keto reductase [uncultured Litoreibacter sp.]|uniref:aldo/keto reductase n=1 Tax=uncultured Litoreibacter sp. TaxID=1392394 RepID=UPI002611040D|nr:aldo/keto reductase [uncultured Litoreibacter sp.]
MTQLFTRSGAPASPLCFGTMQFGSNADHSASAALYAACRDAGISFFDTAYVYNDGISEDYLGAFCAHELDDVLIATKINYGAPSTRETITQSTQTSLDRLKMDSVDLMYLHRWDNDTPLEESLEALAELKQQGKFRYVGISNFAAWQVVKAVQMAATFDLKIDVLQPMYNLVKRQAEVEIIPACADQDVAVVPYSPLGGGLLTGKYAQGAGGRLKDVEMYSKRYDVSWMHDTAAALPGLAAKYGTDPATLAVAWVAHNPGIAAPIISARSVAQLEPSLAAVSFEMTDDIYADMTALTQDPPPATDRLEEA